MEHPVCASCGKPIKPTDSKVTIQGMTQHMLCWDGAVYGAQAWMNGQTVRLSTGLACPACGVKIVRET
jgi:predicted RNA-binding Zn-ribbon protein involved in translation (DUF1610 family)